MAPCILKKNKIPDPYGVSIDWLSALWNALWSLFIQNKCLSRVESGVVNAGLWSSRGESSSAFRKMKLFATVAPPMQVMHISISRPRSSFGNASSYLCAYGATNLSEKVAYFGTELNTGLTFRTSLWLLLTTDLSSRLTAGRRSESSFQETILYSGQRPQT